MSGRKLRLRSILGPDLERKVNVLDRLSRRKAKTNDHQYTIRKREIGLGGCTDLMDRRSRDDIDIWIQSKHTGQISR
jgi:hypothetical protein